MSKKILKSMVDGQKITVYGTSASRYYRDALWLGMSIKVNVLYKTGRMEITLLSRPPQTSTSTLCSRCTVHREQPCDLLNCELS